MLTITPKQRVMNSLRRMDTDMVPFTIYDSKLLNNSIMMDLRSRGLCPVKRITSYSTHRPNVKVRSQRFTDEQGRNLVRTYYDTPYGELSTLVLPLGFTTWTFEHMFKTKDDYKALSFLINDTVITPNYDYAAKVLNEAGEDYVVRDQIPLEPLQNLISSYMGTETYCLEWMDNRDEIMKLYDTFVEIARKIYPIVADGPLEFANYGGNVVPQIHGVENFKKYFVTHYNEAAEILHKKGKLIGTHLDADNSTIMDTIADTDLDYIEAYDPGISPPVKEARKKWPNKVLWLNWPSAWHLEPLDKIKPLTMELIEEAHPGDGFIIGITEDVPEERFLPNLTAIMEGVEEAALKD